MYLPENSPVYWQFTDDKPFSLATRFVYLQYWQAMQQTVILARMAGSKDAKLPFDKLPEYPWEDTTSSQKIGGLKGADPQKALEYLLSL